MNFRGSVEDIKEIVAACGLEGRWGWRADHRFYAFRATSGETLAWWPRAGSLLVEGRLADRFKQKLKARIDALQFPLLAMAQPAHHNAAS